MGRGTLQRRSTPIGDTNHAAIEKMTPDGKVLLADAELFTALLLSFHEIIRAIKSILDHPTTAT